jgi:aminopeptidase N
MAKAEKKNIVRRADYKPPVFLVDATDLDFDIRDKTTRVRAKLDLRRNPESRDQTAPLLLNGENQKLLGLWLNGKKLGPKDYTLTETTLTIPFVADLAELVIESENEPDKNYALSGLYRAGALLTTQCESEGFRRITYFPDRPDVSSLFRVTIHADKKRYPVLLSNGNRIKGGNEGQGRHFAVWEDPHKKPCYLFALVAGKLDCASTHFTTKSGRRVLIEAYTDPGRKRETRFILDAAQKAMRWDEKTYGLEYDLDRYMMVAVSAFNYGAMENKGLNIFNDTCALGVAETAKDSAIAFFERVVGHEYFHNYTGDRVTCRDWFQLSLKEGLTVFREQEFCADMDSRALERLATVSVMRSQQFAEDASARAHSVRPDAYNAIDNFYTRTIYKKGAEICRMLQTMVGEQGFRKGLRLYLKRHDGSSATCDDFVAAIGEANGIDLTPFMIWYAQAGTPTVKIRTSYDKKAEEYTLRIAQSCPPTPGQKKKKPMPMPIAIGLLDEAGKDMVGTLVLDLRESRETFIIKGVREKPVPSLLRNFSAPVRLDYPFTEAELLFLMANDPDSFNRWDSAQKLFTKYMLAEKELPKAFLEALRVVLRNRKIDDGFKAAMMTPPSETELGLNRRVAGKTIDPAALHATSERAVLEVASYLEDDLRALYLSIAATLDAKASDGKARGSRLLKNLCLSYLSRLGQEEDLAAAYGLAVKSPNMTDKVAGLSILVQRGDAHRKKAALDRFEAQFGGTPTIMDDWFSIQAEARKEDVLKDVRRLAKHPVFTLKNPNRLRALLAVFAANPLGFHAPDGSGYRFIADLIPTIDRLNPHSSTRLLESFMRFKDYEPKRRAMMKAALQKLAKKRGLSANARELIESAVGK